MVLVSENPSRQIIAPQQFNRPKFRRLSMTVASWFSKITGAKSLDNLEDLLMEQLKDLYSAEQQLHQGASQDGEGSPLSTV